MNQLRALVALRWRMVREPGSRRRLLLLPAGLAVLLVASVAVGQSMPPGDDLLHLLLLTPTLLLVFAGLSLVPPLVAGGGNELYPDGQLVAYPVTPRTVFLSGVLIAPLNLAWITQVLMLTGVMAAVAFHGPFVVLTLVTTGAYVVLVTVGAQAVAWASVGVRATATGRAVLRGVVLLLAAVAVGVAATGRSVDVLDYAPTKRVAVGALSGAQGPTGYWLGTTLLLVALTLVVLRLGVVSCDWALRQVAPRGRPELAAFVRRPPRRTAFAELVAVDRSSVWRSTSLRRGLVVLALLPGVVAMLADPTWPSLPLLPGLVAAGAGLLFGVNVFCLDGGGAMWVATLPHDPRDSLLAKLVVVGQTCLGTVVIALVVAATRLDRGPTGAEAVALLGSAVGSTLVVVAICARLSVTRPHKADLRGPRDTPAPPAAMAGYSMRLALQTTFVGLLLAGAAASGSRVAAAAGGFAVLALAVRSLSKTLTTWRSVTHRAHVITTVSYG